MTPVAKTLLFVAIACGSTIAAFATHRTFQVDLTKKISDEGEEFFPEFNDPDAATSLAVAAYDSTAARVNEFKVEKSDGKWRIPSHNNYPADAKDRLRETAASVIGVRREVQVGESADDHRRYNLIDPLAEGTSGEEGRGTRITIKDGDTVLLDYIVGKKVEDVGTDVYYIRKADEPRYYRANLGKFSISTKFGDWIEPDLLQVSPSDIEELGVNRYKIDLATGEQTEPDVTDLTRKDASAEWQLAGLDTEKEKVKTSVVTEMLNALDDLKIVGVRRKPEPVIAMLRGEKPRVTQSQMLEVQLDMQSKGFVLQRSIIPVSGSVSVGTFGGLAYELAFGSVFSGTEIDVEVGQKKAAAAAASPAEGEKPAEDAGGEAAKAESGKPADDAKAGEADKPDAEGADGEKKDETKLVKSRYVFIQTRFDEKLLGEKPTPPVKPEPPKEEAAKPADEPKAEKPAEEAKDDAKQEDAKDADEKKDEPKPDAAAEEKKDDTEKAAEEKPAAEKPADEKPAEEAKKDAAKPEAPQPTAEELKQKYETDLKEYELQNEVYEQKKKDYDKKVADGKKRVEQLNRRFAEWYYVVSEDVYEGLRSRRADFIEPKDPPKTDAATGRPMIPSIPGLDGLPIPGGSKATEEKPEVTKPAEPRVEADKPAEPKGDEPKPEAKPTEPKGDEPEPEAKPADPAPAKEAPKAEEKAPEVESAAKPEPEAKKE